MNPYSISLDHGAIDRQATHLGRSQKLFGIYKESWRKIITAAHTIHQWETLVARRSRDLHIGDDDVVYKKLSTDVHKCISEDIPKCVGEVLKVCRKHKLGYHRTFAGPSEPPFYLYHLHAGVMGFRVRKIIPPYTPGQDGCVVEEYDYNATGQGMANLEQPRHAMD